MDFPRHVFELLQKQMAQTGRIGASRIFTTPAVASPAANGGVSAPSNVRFNVSGYALALYGQEIAGTAAQYAQCAMRVQIGGTEDLIIDGQGGPSFMSFLAAFGGTNNWFPLMRRVAAGVDWVFTFRNDTAAGTINPKVHIAVLADVDILATDPHGGR